MLGHLSSVFKRRTAAPWWPGRTPLGVGVERGALCSRAGPLVLWRPLARRRRASAQAFDDLGRVDAAELVQVVDWWFALLGSDSVDDDEGRLR